MKTEVELLREQLVAMDRQLELDIRKHRGVLVAHTENPNLHLTRAQHESLGNTLALAIRKGEGYALVMPPGWDVKWLMGHEAAAASVRGMMPEQRLNIINDYCQNCGEENINRCSCGGDS